MFYWFCIVLLTRRCISFIFFRLLLSGFLNFVVAFFWLIAVLQNLLVCFWFHIRDFRFWCCSKEMAHKHTWDISFNISSFYEKLFHTVCHVHTRTWTSISCHWIIKHWYIYIRHYTDEHPHALKINFSSVNISFGPQCEALNIQTCSAPRSSEINFNVTTLILASWLLNWFNYRILLADIDQPSLKGGVYPCNWLWCISSRRGTQWCGQTRNSVIEFKGHDSARSLEEHRGPRMRPLRWRMMTKLNVVHSLLVLLYTFTLHSILIFNQL